jgi:RNA polymerase sigma-70 factor (ECF subfamily)
MLIPDSTSAVVRQVPAELFRRSPGTTWTSSPTGDRTPGDVAAAIELLRRPDGPQEGSLSDQEAYALELLYRRYAAVVSRVAVTLTRNAADAEDVAHDVFIGLPRALRRYRPGNFEAWLKTVTARTALMRIRRGARERDAQTSLAITVDEPHGGDGETLVDSDRVRRAAARLPESLRHVLVLRIVRGLPHAEIGRLLGLTPNACEVRLCRAIKQLRALVGEAA